MVDTLTPELFCIVVHNVVSDTLLKCGITTLSLPRSDLKKTIPVFSLEGSIFKLTFFPE